MDGQKNWMNNKMDENDDIEYHGSHFQLAFLLQIEEVEVIITL